MEVKPSPVTAAFSADQMKKVSEALGAHSFLMGSSSTTAAEEEEEVADDDAGDDDVDDDDDDDDDGDDDDDDDDEGAPPLIHSRSNSKQGPDAFESPPTILNGDEKHDEVVDNVNVVGNDDKDDDREAAALLLEKHDEEKEALRAQARAFFDEVVVKVEIAVSQNAKLEAKHEAAVKQLVLLKQQVGQAQAELGTEKAGRVVAEDARETLERRLATEEEQYQRQLTLARESENAAIDRATSLASQLAGSVELEAVARVELREADERARVAVVKADEKVAEIRLHNTAIKQEMLTHKKEAADQERAANEQRGRAYALEEQLLKQRKRVDELMLSAFDQNEARKLQQHEQQQLQQQLQQTPVPPMPKNRHSPRDDEEEEEEEEEDSPAASRSRLPPPTPIMRQPKQASPTTDGDQQGQLRKQLNVLELRAVTELHTILRAGLILVKHGRAGTPKPRRFFIGEGRELFWESKRSKSGSFVLEPDVAVTRGKSTRMFERATGTAADLCFSLVRRRRPGSRDTLDLEASSKQERNAIADGFALLVRHLATNPGTAPFSSPMSAGAPAANSMIMSTPHQRTASAPPSSSPDGSLSDVDDDEATP